MKLRLHWAEKYEMVREYPSFELDSTQFPELELEMMEVYRAESANQQQQALEALEYKMHHTRPAPRGETIFEMVGPYNSFEDANVYPITEQEGSFQVSEEDNE